MPLVTIPGDADQQEIRINPEHVAAIETFGYGEDQYIQIHLVGWQGGNRVLQVGFGEGHCRNVIHELGG